ncbi:MAG TPA: prepilin-type N-terminal cleavage/methylation domain-containing protein [Candidatus Methylacidiphilales bacterium]
MSRGNALRRDGFSLAEILVAVAILSIVILVVAQIVGATARVIDYSVRNMDAATQANQALDRIGSDLRRLVRRTDLAPSVTLRQGNDALQFYAAVPAYEGTRGVSLVSYRIAASGDDGSPVLQRGAYGSGWSAGSPPQVAFSGPGAVSATVPEANFQTLAPAVFRMELAFVSRSSGAFMKSPATADWSDAAGVWVTLAALDAKSRQALGTRQGAVIGAFGTALADFDGAAGVAGQWEQAARNPGADAALPAAMRGRLRIVQRFYEW